MSQIKASIEAQERWLRSGLREDLLEAELDDARRRMRRSALAFFRAASWRWAEQAAAICPDLASVPLVLALGDVHVESFGVWRDREARLVWGVIDFDEAARTSYAFDLVRLAASAILAGEEARLPEPEAAVAAILDGYQSGLAAPRPFILENGHRWLDDLVRPSGKARRAFWAQMAQLRPETLPPAFQTLLQAALPGERSLTLARGQAELRAMARPLFIGVSADPERAAARRAWALVPPAWERTADIMSAGRRLLGLSRGPHRSPDPWFDFHQGALVTRLAPDSRRLGLEALEGRIGRKLLCAMGWEVANIHAAEASRAGPIRADLQRRPEGWLLGAARAAAASALVDWRAWRR